eukprot:gene5013-34798_t
MDPLSLLRDFNIKNKLEAVVSNSDRVNFGDSYVFPKTSYTAFKRAGGAQDFYTLEVVLYLLKNRNLSHPEYIKQGSSDRVGTVTNLDRKKLLDILDGKADVALDASVAAGGMLPGMAASAPSEMDVDTGPESKRARVEDVKEVTVFEALAKQERQLRNRNTMLVANGKSFSSVLDLVEKTLTSMRQSQNPPSAQKSQGVKRPHPGTGEPHSSQKGGIIPVKQSGRFDRENATDQLKAMAGEGAAQLANVIDMYGYGYNKTSSQPNPSASKPHSSSQSSRPSSSSKHQSSQPAPSKSLAAPASKSRAGGLTAMINLLNLKHGGLAAMINLINVKQFLEEGFFETSGDAQAMDTTTTPPPHTLCPPPQACRHGGLTAMINLINVTLFFEEGFFETSGDAQAMDTTTTPPPHTLCPPPQACRHGGLTAMINLVNVKQFLEEGFFETGLTAMMNLFNVRQFLEEGRFETSLTAMMNLFNVKQFLEEGRFETSGDAQARGVVKHPLLVINRTALKPNSKPVPYHVMDKAPPKGSDDWKRVVAVIAQGAKWQFKDFPHKGSDDWKRVLAVIARGVALQRLPSQAVTELFAPLSNKWLDKGASISATASDVCTGAEKGELVELFSQLCGFFMHWSDEKPSDMVSTWNVKRLGIHRINRHLDNSLMIDFFRQIDSFLQHKKSDLAY